MTHAHQSRTGYILLLSILIVGTIASAAVTSALLLGTDNARTSLVVEQSTRAAALAQGCVEHALMELRDNPAYAGDELLAGFTGGGTCEILPIGGAGNTNRIVCAEGRSGDAFRRVELIVAELFPVTKVFSWQDVPVFTLCL